MKNVVAYLILLLETIGIIAASVIYANKASMHSAINIQVPDGMQLTLSKEIEIDTADGSIVLSEGTVVTPEYIFPHDVHFQYEGTNKRVHADWDNFKEKQQLEALKIKAEHDLEDRIEKGKFKCIAIGAAIGIVWLVLGGILSSMLIKHEKGIIAIIIHGIVIMIIIFNLYTLNAYLWH
jgi:hypothetical protein